MQEEAGKGSRDKAYRENACSRWRDAEGPSAGCEEVEQGNPDTQPRVENEGLGPPAVWRCAGKCCPPKSAEMGQARAAATGIPEQPKLVVESV